MQLVTLHDISLSHGKPPLLDHIGLAIESGERVCLIGSNGAGKTTLLKIVAGQVMVDDGFVKLSAGVRITHLEQEVPQDTAGTVFDIIAGGLGAEGKLAQRYHQLTTKLSERSDTQAIQELEIVQEELDRFDGWDMAQRVESIITNMNLLADAEFVNLSGGFKRRVMLARALVTSPDLLLLDEPTNHLDIEAIKWIEQFLLKWKGALLFVSHDRRFMDNLATRFIELDRGKLTEFKGGYHAYRRRKKEMDEVEAKHNALFDKRLSEEEVWIRQGIKARRTRNESRIKALEAMRKDYADRRRKEGLARITVQQAERSGKIIAEADGISFAFGGGHNIVQNFSTVIQRGDKVGLIGANGAGKTTLLKLLLGELVPDKGVVQTGTNLSIAYFDQHRSTLDESKSVQDSVSEGTDMLEIGGKSRHVLSYLKDFLFSPNRCRQPVRALSGGERNRLLLAKLFTIASNVLVLDEPTNDLDIDTLDLLEELLIDYQGTILLVSHDRAFINNVVTSTLVFEDEGVINGYLGGYDDWLRQRPVQKSSVPREIKKNVSKTRNCNRSIVKKLSFKDQRELDHLPTQIEELEGAITEISEQLSQPTFYESDRSVTARVEQRLAGLQQQLNVCYARWESLEDQ
jgi:ATP-binding cassette subfamily F protein uup